MLLLYSVYVCVKCSSLSAVFFQAEDGIRDLVRSRGLGDVYKRQDQGSARGRHRRGCRPEGRHHRRDPVRHVRTGDSLSLIHI